MQASFLFFNDTMYVAHHLIYLGHVMHSSLPAPVREISTFVDMLPLFRQRLAVPVFQEAFQSLRTFLSEKLALRGVTMETASVFVKDVYWIKIQPIFAMTMKRLPLQVAGKVICGGIEVGLLVFFEDIKACNEWTRSRVLLFQRYADVFITLMNKAVVSAADEQGEEGQKQEEEVTKDGVAAFQSRKHRSFSSLSAATVVFFKNSEEEEMTIPSTNLFKTFDQIVKLLEAMSSGQWAVLPALCRQFPFAPIFSKAELRAMMRAFKEIPSTIRDSCLKCID